VLGAEDDVIQQSCERARRGCLPAPAGRDDDSARILSTGCAALHPRPWACAPAGQDTDHPADLVTHPVHQVPHATRLRPPNPGSAKLQLCTRSDVGAPHLDQSRARKEAANPSPKRKRGMMSRPTRTARIVWDRFPTGQAYRPLPPCPACPERSRRERSRRVPAVAFIP